MYERWEYIPGFGTRYKISNLGRIYSTQSGKILKTCVSNKGYELAHLCNGSQHSKQYSVHRLVAKTFIPNPENLPVINHKDENKLNNSAENLEWCTYGYNNSYNSVRTKMVHSYEKNNCLPFVVYDERMRLIGIFVNVRKFLRERGMQENSGNFYATLMRNRDCGLPKYSCCGYIPMYLY